MISLCVWQALQRAVKLEGAKIGWSMLTVAHRLQTIMDYDRVAGMAGVPSSEHFAVMPCI